MQGNPSFDEPTVVGPQPTERALLWTLGPVLGAGAGWLVVAAVGWLLSLPWVPMQGLLRLIDSVPHPYGPVGGVVLGVGAGLVVAYLAERDHVVTTVDRRQLTLTHEGVSRTVARGEVAAVFVDGKRLVVLGHDTRELAGARGDLSADRIGAALRAHGYPWRPDGDPYRADYRRWVEDTPDLSASANATLRARARALEKGDRRDLADYTRDLSGMGVVIRDEGKRQYWRHARALEADRDPPAPA